MSDIFLQLSKSGDILSLLPCLYHQFQQTGKKPLLMVSREYSKILSRAPYVEPVLHDGWQDLAGALRRAKREYDHVVCTQLHGDGFKFQRRHPSWQHDQWERAGYLEKWDTLPLVLDRPANASEIVALYIHGPTILYADHGQSSPFWHKDDLARLLVEKFSSTHRILRLSEVNLPNPLDLLALFDAVDVLVTVDSLPIHLSAASKVPTIALASDNPSRWQGTAWSKRFAFYCRYSEYERRKHELVEAISVVISKRSKSTVKTLDAGFPFAYNPSTVEIGGRTVFTSRYHPDPKKWRTELAYHDGTKSWPIKPPELYAEFSHEDARLFFHKGELHVTWVISRTTPQNGVNLFRSAVAYGKIVKTPEGYSIANTVLPRYGRNMFDGNQKNWLPVSVGNDLWFIWGIKDGGKQYCIKVDGESISKEESCDGPAWAYGEIRGGAIVPHGEHLLRFFHSRDGERVKGEDYKFRYYTGCMLMKSKPPFKPVKVCSKPIILGNEEYMPGSPSWKRNVAIPFGCIAKEGKYHLSLGTNDSACRVVELSEADLYL